MPPIRRATWQKRTDDGTMNISHKGNAKNMKLSRARHELDSRIVEYSHKGNAKIMKLARARHVASSSRRLLPPQLSPRFSAIVPGASSTRMRKPMVTQDTGGPSSTQHVSPYRPASPHHHPSPPFEQMHFDSGFINLDPNAGGFFETSYEGGHHSQHLGGDHIHNDQEDDQDHEDNREQEHDDESTNDSDDAEHSSHDHDEGADQGQGPTNGTMPFTPIALGLIMLNGSKKTLLFLMVSVPTVNLEEPSWKQSLQSVLLKHFLVQCSL
ncbi:OLC1v1013647C1 [Oldenlandia corymbosa var. corymbosa]|uniref:OLC1v1013647C1 n=1 Tax=Oldenlandia corymbosa var. corymbosa TaxID=529605 RepID=A0AAV1DYQ9_OLDCO|nr:OLC1v1013647C1 [Oldenlandia corymbosa var. corymbosa]